MSPDSGIEPSTPHEATRYGGLALCDAKRTGRSSSGPGRCRHLAGWGTDHPGIGRCRLHGGSTPTHQRSAVKREASQRLAALGSPIAIDPHVALILEVHRTSGHVQFIASQIEGVDDLASHDARVLVEMYQRERSHLVRAAKAAMDAGVLEAEIRLAERQGQLIAQTILGILGALGLTQTQFHEARKLVGRELRALSAGEVVES
jgi:hypothetical protein